MTLYSKDSATVPFNAMAKSNRFVHSFILTGDSGVGKKTCARYLAQLLLCDNKNACGTCRQCRRILANQHPDYTEVPHGSGAVPYTVSCLREEVIPDSIVAPNDCERKVYLLYDCDGWKDAAQDVMLKVTEDPPNAAYFIFTAKSREVFLPTLISRSMTAEIHEATPENCTAALLEHSAEFKGAKKKKYSPEAISAACRLFSGNIGCCIEFIEGDGKLAKAANAADTAANAAAAGDEYALAVALNSVTGKDCREVMTVTLELLSKIIRDCAVLKVGKDDTIGCSPQVCRRIAERYSLSRLLDMYDALCETAQKLAANCSPAAAAAVLAGRICG